MWANRCAACFDSKGAGIGWTQGQRYARQPNGDWRMVAGFPQELPPKLLENGHASSCRASAWKESQDHRLLGYPRGARQGPCPMKTQAAPGCRGTDRSAKTCGRSVEHQVDGPALGCAARACLGDFPALRSARGRVPTTCGGHGAAGILAAGKSLSDCDH